MNFTASEQENTLLLVIQQICPSSVTHTVMTSDSSENHQAIHLETDAENLPLHDALTVGHHLSFSLLLSRPSICKK